MTCRCFRVLTGIGLTTVFLIASADSASGEDITATVSATLPTASDNDSYVGNRRPLEASPLYKLPVGSIEPQGWLGHQLELMGRGLTGRLPEISRFCKYEGNAWSDPKGSWPFKWEELPYWLRGYISLSYLLQDVDMIAESNRWVEATLSGQQADGYFGPQTNKDNNDLWPNMIMLYVLRTYHEATKDPRIIELMKRYFRWQSSLPADHFLPGSWQKVRGADNLDSIYWLYNHTGESWLLDLAGLNHDRTSEWPNEGEDWHGVNLCQRFRGPAQYYQQTHDERDLKTTEDYYGIVMDRYGQVPGGMFGADEETRVGYAGPRQAAETCSMTEFMHSDQLLLKITGQAVWADRCEDVAFNSLPAAQTPDLKALHYLTAPNQIQLDRQNKKPMIHNPNDMFSFSPYEQYRCCQHNVAFGWPYYAEHLWLATASNGLAATLYASCTVKAKVGDEGTEVRITETTNYPFDEKIVFELAAPRPVRFPLTLRVPGWCNRVDIRVNDKPVESAAKPGEWVTIERTWTGGDIVELNLLMTIRLRTWTANADSVSVDRGPLTYSLKIGERWERYSKPEEWACYEVFPTTPWNYALVVSPTEPEKTITVAKRRQALAPQPFAPDTAPIVLKAKGRKVPLWRQEDNGMIGMLPKSPVPADKLEPQTEDITLIPMGCARLRVSAFPVAQQDTR